MRPLRWLGGLAAAGLAVAACTQLGGPIGPYRPPVAYPPPPEELVGVELGRFVFQRDCASCHGSQGEGTDRGPDLRTGTNGPALTDFVLRTGRMPIAHEDQPMRRRDPVYTAEQIDAIVAFVDETVDPPGPPVPRPETVGTEAVATGQQIYQRHCAACHATTGIGGAMVTRTAGAPTGARSGVVIPGLDAATPVEVAEAVRTGPGSMPVFADVLISDDELAALVAYVELLQDPPDPGGAGIGHVGPAVEGAVGWVAGLGVLVLFVVWVGSRAGDEP